ncbi:MAG: hypothetical protein P4L53_21690 [Candidatus Obscuribacterales bacterium]|nr:hypothetical protein [Candidatus Obscuribacterales bacterium]
MHSIWTKLLLGSTLTSFATFSLADEAVAQAGRNRQFRPTASPRVNAPALVGKVNPALQPYLIRIQNKLNKNWYLPDGNNHVTLTVNVATDGNATDAVAAGSPKNQPAETAAMDAFNNSSPLEPLPSGVNSGKLILRFDSTADPHGDSHSNISVRFEPNPTAPPAAPPTATAPAAPAPAAAAPQTTAPEASAPATSAPATSAPATSAPAAAALSEAAAPMAAPEMVPGTSVPVSAYASQATAAAAASVAKAAASAPAAQGLPSNAPPREALPAYVPPSAAATAQAAAAQAATAPAAPAAAPAAAAPAAAAPAAPPAAPATPADLLKSLP